MTLSPRGVIAAGLVAAGVPTVALLNFWLRLLILFEFTATDEEVLLHMGEYIRHIFFIEMRGWEPFVRKEKKIHNINTRFLNEFWMCVLGFIKACVEITVRCVWFLLKSNY